jgi:hypothetical protein
MTIPCNLRRSRIRPVLLCRDVTARDRGRSVGASDVPRDDPFLRPALTTMGTGMWHLLNRAREPEEIPAPNGA